MLEDKNQEKTSLEKLGEFGLIEHLTKDFKIEQKSTLKGIGDDAAVLDFMLYEAKKLYFVKSIIPDIPDQILLNYTDEQLKWFDKNQHHKIQKKLLKKGCCLIQRLW